MIDQDAIERKNQRTGTYVSVGVHVLLLLLFYFLVAWSEPDPPIPEYGIELGVITSNQSNAQAQQNNSNTPQQSEPTANEVPDETTNQDETLNEEEVAPEAQEEVIPDEITPETEDVNSPDVTTQDEKVDDTNPSEETDENNLEEPAETEETEEVVETTGDSDTEETQVSDVPKVDERALYSGSGDSDAASGAKNGASLDLSGWIWDFTPNPDDKSQENGRIVFEIKVDEEGEIIQIRTLTKTVSPVVEKVYRNAVMELTFSKTSENQSSARVSTGRITFIIQSR